MNLLPEPNYEFAGISDSIALKAETDDLYTQLETTTAQLALERDLATKIHRARTLAIWNSAALRLVFGNETKDSTTTNVDVSTDERLSSAFRQKVSSPDLPEGFASTLSRRLRAKHHPDTGGNSTTARNISQHLDRLKTDPIFAVASAILESDRPEDDKPETLRIERYQLHLTLAGTCPQFSSKQEALKYVDTEIEATEWRVRTQAAIKTFGLIIGDNDSWEIFLRDIVRTPNMRLVNLVNDLIPPILALQERILKGDPIAADKIDIKTVDTIFARIWSTIGSNKDSSIPYSPPYQHWLEVLKPALELLDPGQKAGEEYTHFRPPIQVVRTPTDFQDFGSYDKSSANDKILRTSYKEQKYSNSKYM